MAVIIAVPAPYRKATGGKAELEIEASCVGQVIDGLVQDYPDLAKRLVTAEGSLNPHVSVYVNGSRVSRGEAMERALNDGDRLVIMPVISGG